MFTDDELPPGQHPVATFPATTGPHQAVPPVVATADWELTLTTEDGDDRRWDWTQFRALPSERICVDLHCVEGWSVVGSSWEATPVQLLFIGVTTSAEFVSVSSFDHRTTNLPLEDLLEMPTWIAFSLEGQALRPALGGPARLLVPHLYLWKSVPWVSGITLTVEDQPGFHEVNGFHNYGDPWREQRHRGD